MYRVCLISPTSSVQLLILLMYAFCNLLLLLLLLLLLADRLCGLVVRVLGYRSGGPSSIPDTTRKKSSGSETGSTQPREYN
jgi:hypothetical protein